MSGFVDPAAVFPGRLLFVAPHMDDEVLACGGTIASLPDKERVHVAYATDGAGSPVPAFEWIGQASPDLPRIRRAEARAALKVLGISEQNTHFLDFPDRELKKHGPAVRAALVRLFERLRPSCVFIPFRYDRHPDHVALHHAALQACDSPGEAVQIVEYFVYYRWRLLPGGDVRKMIRPEHLLRVDIREQSLRKRRALDCYVSQATRFFQWQDRPILPADRLADVSRSPELFLKYQSDCAGPDVLARLRHWIPVIHRLEPSLKRRKDELKVLGRVSHAWGRARPAG